ncbi:hypothetical protein, partial [Streptomyces sp. URMC 129]|uniref:hypothetical protein n=1 Tax=Streptomyces sp. URMC 129 TaxID=3423407 RepID=UPI003F1DAF96
MAFASLPRPAGGALRALVRLAPPIGTAWLARALLDGHGPASGATWWVAGGAAVALALRLLPLAAPGPGPRGRAVEAA